MKLDEIAFLETDTSTVCEESGIRLDLFVSQVAKEGFEKTIGEIPNSIVLHNFIDFDVVKEKALEENNSEYSTNGMKFIAVGRLSKEKGYNRLVDIVGDLENQFDFELWLIGDGPEREKIERVIQEKSINSIKLFGFKRNPYSYMKKADMIICSSFYEGYSTVVAEALSMGIPVITTDCAGMNELLNCGEFGIITENSEEGLKKGLSNVLESDELFRKYKNACLLHSAECSKSSAMKEYDNLFMN